MARTRVLQIGIDPAVVDFSPWPDQSADALRARIREAQDELRDAGFDVSSCLVTGEPDAAEAAVGRALADQTFDVVEIGSGLRTSHEHALVFERVVNAVAASQPGVRLCFNDSPETTLDAVRRGVAR